jgi:DNA-binding NtrC family response regulator
MLRGKNSCLECLKTFKEKKEQRVDIMCRGIISSIPELNSHKTDLKSIVDNVEKFIIMKAIEHTNTTIEAAILLGIARSTLLSKCKKMRIKTKKRGKEL